MHRTPTIVALAACGLSATSANAQWVHEFTHSGQEFGEFEATDVALGDLDGDGDLDAMFAFGLNLPNTVWINDGTGFFTDSGQALGNTSSNSVALGDLDGDGDLDAMVTSYGEPDTVWTNDGTGTFTNSGQTLGNSGSTSVALGDLDGDGDLDAMVARAAYDAGRRNTVWFNDGTGTFTRSGQTLGNGISSSIALGDLDGDGDLDAMVANDSSGVCDDPQPNTVWTNDGTGTFTDSGQALGNFGSHAVALGDLDGDGDLDAMVGNACSLSYSNPNTVWLNDGTGTFADSGQRLSVDTYGDSTNSIALGDLDDDGDLDVIVANRGGPNHAWYNDGTGNFTDLGHRIGDEKVSESVALGDLDGDGDLDMMFANSSGMPSSAWLTSLVCLTCTPGDLNCDAVYDEADLQIAMADFGITEGSESVPGDLDGDGDFDEADARLAMTAFGIVEASDCQGDVNGDGIVNAADLGIVIGVWGNCP